MASGAIAHCGETQIGIGCVNMLTSGGFSGTTPLSQFQRLFSDINMHVMSLRFGDFRVGTTDFVFVTWTHSRCEEATTRFEPQDGLQPSAPSL